MTEPDYETVLATAKIHGISATPMGQDLINALQCALVMKLSLETANKMLVERDRLMREATDGIPAFMAKAQEIVAENERLHTLLATIPAIAEEIHAQWDKGMKSGKLLIALMDPDLHYREDISALHDEIAAHKKARGARLEAETALTFATEREAALWNAMTPEQRGRITATSW